MYLEHYGHSVTRLSLCRGCQCSEIGEIWMGWWYGDVGSGIDGAWAEIHKPHHSPPTDPGGIVSVYLEKYIVVNTHYPSN